MFRAAVPTLRSSATRSIFVRSAGPTSNTPLAQQVRSQLCTTSSARSRILAPALASRNTLSLVRWQSNGRPPVDKIDEKREGRIAEKTLQPTPETVSSSSTVLPLVGASEGKQQEDDTNMMGGINSDLQTIRDTFSLQEVPRQAYYMGLAGVLPYMATSLSTVYCAYEINRASEFGTGLLMTQQYAEALLHVIEPVQVGYGAVIISFLGAIHWGLEWAGYGGNQGYPRYMIGVVSTAFAWPTIFMPVEYALISQFLVFNFLYYSDSRATKRGWAPHWYGVYRFVLTFIVGSSIVLSLIGRGQIADRIETPSGTVDRFKRLRGNPVESFEEEEEARKKYLGDESGDDDEEEEDDEEEGGDDEKDEGGDDEE